MGVTLQRNHEKNFVVCHELSNVELMQRFMNLCKAGHHGSMISAYAAQEGLDLLAEIMRRMEKSEK